MEEALVWQRTSRGACCAINGKRTRGYRGMAVIVARAKSGGAGKTRFESKPELGNSDIVVGLSSVVGQSCSASPGFIDNRRRLGLVWRKGKRGGRTGKGEGITRLSSTAQQSARSWLTHVRSR